MAAPRSAAPEPPLLLREPFRLFMPLGVLLGWAGVSHWLLHAVGLLERYHPIFHALAQVQGFLMAFATGFLMTAVPKRTGTPPAAPWQLAVAAVCLVGTTGAAFFERWLLSQALWLALALLLAGFVLRRGFAAGARRRPPVSFIWLPVGLGMGIVGAILTALGGGGGGLWELHEIGRGLVLQGMFLGFVIGVGSFALPLMTRGQAAPDATATRRDRRATLAHLGGAAALAGTFVLERRWPAAAHLLRGTIVLVALVLSGGLARLPDRPGANRRLIWAAAWLVPAGYLLAALFPARPKAALHVTFIGGFALLALAVGAHVAAGHGGREDLKSGRAWPLALGGALLLLATIPRALVDLDPARFFLWLGLSAALFLGATLPWLLLLLPVMWPGLRAGRPGAPGGDRGVGSGVVGGVLERPDLGRGAPIGLQELSGK